MIEVFKLSKIDEEIVRNIKELALQANPRAKDTRYGREEWVCMKVLAKRLLVGISLNDNKEKYCAQIFYAARKHADRKGTDVNTVISECFCLQFGINM
jgi:hypothetical protein